jgi:Xaa-Pro aminopeptidase
LLTNQKGVNPNYTMFTLIEEHSGPVFLLILPGGKSCFFCSSLEAAVLRPFEKEAEIIIYKNKKKLFSLLKKVILPKKSLYIEVSEKYPLLDIVSAGQYLELKKYFNLHSAEKILYKLRTIKTETEIKLIKKAVRITKSIFKKLSKEIKPFVSEIDIYRKMHALILENENTGMSFQPIIAGGRRSKDPHPVRYTSRKFKKGDRVIIDMGVSYLGYTSDITRTYILGEDKEAEKFKKVSNKMYQAMLNADLRKHSFYSLGALIHEIAKENNVANFEKHGYGHGLGVETHDFFPPKQRFKNNMVFAFEPGFYSNRGGFRIEKDYVIKKGRAVEL